MKAATSPDAVDGQDHHADDGGHAGGQRRTEDAQPKGEDEHIVQNHIGQAAQHHGGHGQLGRAVVADKAEKQVVEQKHGGEQQNDLQVGGGHFKHGAVGTQQAGQGAGQQQAHQKKDHRKPCGQQYRCGECPVGFLRFSLVLADGVLGAARPMPTIRPLPWIKLYTGMARLRAARPSAPIPREIK